MFQEDDTTRKFLHVLRLCWSLPGPPWPENCFPDFWCLCNVWMNMNGHISRLISLVSTWYHFTVQKKGRESSRQEWQCIFYPSSAHSLTSAIGKQAVIFLPWRTSKTGKFKPSASPKYSVFSPSRSRLTAVNPIHEQRWGSNDKHVG